MTFNNSATAYNTSAYIIGQLKVPNRSLSISPVTYQTRILLDTGATLCAINMRTLKDINNMLMQRGQRKLFLTRENSSPVAANRQALTTVGNVTLTVIFPGEKNILEDVIFTVIPGLNARAIIGMNAIRQIGLSVNRTSIKVAGHRVQLISTVDNMENGSETFSTGSTFNHSFEPATQPGDATEMKGTSPIDIRKNDTGNQPGCKPEPTSSLMQTEYIHTEDHITEMESLVSLSDLSNSGKLRLTKILQRHKGNFSTSEFDVGKYTGAQVKLRFRPDCGDPVYVPCRRIPHALRSTLIAYLEQMEKAKIIQKIEGSPWNSPLFFVQKKSGKWRPVSDFRLMNNKLESWNFPIPHLRDLLDRLDGSKFFSAIDLRSGFFNIELKKESRECTAFSCLGQTWMFNRLPQGVKQSPAIFQAIMTKITQGIPCTLVYMDDLLIYSKTEKECLDTIEAVLSRFQEFGMKINLAKSEFAKREIIYLGYQISSNGWKPTRSKIDAIQKMKPPTCAKDCRTFAGMLNFCSSAIPRLSVIMGPINRLSGKKTFQWEANQQKAFEQAKQAIADAVELSFPSKNPEDRLVVTSDASDTGWGGSLSQIRVKTGVEKPLGYTSGTWHDAEERWPIAEKELCAYMRTLKHFDTYLIARTFVWRTDNKSLSYLLSETLVKRTAMSTFTPKIGRWLDFIGGFDFEIEHFNGTEPEMTACDYLSRSTANQIQSLSNIDYDNIWMTSGITLAELKREQENDKQVQNYEKGYKILTQSKIFKVENKNGVLMAKKKGQTELKLIIPTSLVDSVLSWTHSYSHRGITSMLKTMQKQFFIPNCTKAVQDYIKTCEVCARKPGRKPNDLPIKQTSAKHPWSCVHMDLMGPMNESENGNKYILAMVDSLTRWTELRCIPTKHAQCVADAAFDIFCNRGPPLSILCDNGKEFYNEGLRIMMRNLGVHIQFSTPRRPQTNGLVERVNQKVKRQLQNFKATENNWEDFIPPIQLTINLEHNRNLNCSPWTAIHGWSLQRMEYLDSKVLENRDISEYNSKTWSKWHSVRMTKFLEEIYRRDVELKTKRYERLKKMNDGGKTDKNDSRKTLIHTGAKVLIEFPQPQGEVGKLWNPWKGLYIVIKQVDRNTYLVGPAEGTRRKFLVARKRMRVVEDRQSEESIVSPGSNNPEILEHNQQIKKTAQCELPSTTAKAVRDDTEPAKTKRGSSNRHIRTSSAPKLKKIKEQRESTHRMTTRQRSKKTGQLTSTSSH